jgi:hypothetical protein
MFLSFFLVYSRRYVVTLQYSDIYLSVYLLFNCTIVAQSV